MKTPELGSVKTRPKCVQFHHSDPYLKLGPFQVEIVSMQPYRPVHVQIYLHFIQTLFRLNYVSSNMNSFVMNRDKIRIKLKNYFIQILS